MKKSPSTASVLGSILAVIQSLFDDLFSYLFKKLRSAGSKPAKKSDDDITKFFRSIVRFFGELGDAFYSTYERIKKDKKS